MSKKVIYARVAITLPRGDLAAADRIARQQDRPRSWVIAEAIRHYAATAVSTTPAAVDEPDADVAQRRGLGAQRRAQLIADLALTPEARVRAAEETARVALLRNPLRVERVLAFDRYEDYLDWKRLEAAGL